MNKSPIPWLGTDGFTWNPITGCTKGCYYCYARKIALRFGKLAEVQPTLDMPGHMKVAWQTRPYDGPFPFGFWPTTYPARSAEPSRAYKPHTIFVCSMGDLFDPMFTDAAISEVIREIAAAKHHRFVVLTKQPERMHAFFSRCGDNEGMGWTTHDGTPPTPGYDGTGHIVGYGEWPLPNLMLGATVTNQADADERIPLLRDTPAAYRMVSVEPMLGPVVLPGLGDFKMTCSTPPPTVSVQPNIDFVAIGAKTPGKALHEQLSGWTTQDTPKDWLRALLAQCRGMNVPVNYKHANATPAVDGRVYDATVADVMRKERP